MKNPHQILWTVIGFGEEVYPAGQEYRRDNRPQPHPDVVVLHYSLQGELILHQNEQEKTVPEEHLLICRNGDDSFYEKADIEDDYACLWISLRGAGLADHFEGNLTAYRSF